MSLHFRVNLNGHALGIRWYGEHVYHVSSAIQPGQNAISIKIVTTLSNYMKGLKDNAMAMEWTSKTPTYPLGLIQNPKLI